MARDTTNDTPLTDVSQLVEAFSSGCKPREQWRIGTEHEKFGFYESDLTPVPYEGERGIRAILEAMQRETGWEPIVDADRIIGLAGGAGEGAISLEPGGQFELSGGPLDTIHETMAETQIHVDQVRRVCEPLGINFLMLGGSPKWTFAETPKMPKSRYDIMRAYMPKVGTHGLDMMHRTCTIQTNLDFSSEDDMRRKMMVSTRLQSVANALFANSPFTDGKPNGLLSWRGEIWRDTDNQRAGLHEFLSHGPLSFERYADWSVDLPMYFILRDGRYIDCTHITFRQFMNGALKGEIDDPVANEGDWTNHISTLFPDVRLKKILEMRSADGGPVPFISALSAFWVGLLYEDDALDAAEQTIADMSFEQLVEMRDATPAQGFDAPAGDRSVGELARELLGIASRGLEARGRRNADGDTEAIYLEPLRTLLADGRSQAQTMLELYHAEWSRTVDPVFKARTLF